MSRFTSLFHFVDFVNQQLNSVTKLFDLFCVSLCIIFLFLPFVVLLNTRQSLSRRCYNHLVLLGEEMLSDQFIAIFPPHLDWICRAARDQSCRQFGKWPRQREGTATARDLSSLVWSHCDAMRDGGEPVGQDEVPCCREESRMEEGWQPGGEGGEAGLEVEDCLNPALLSPHLRLLSYLGRLPHGETGEQVHQDDHHEEEEEQEDNIAKNWARLEVDVREF